MKLSLKLCVLYIILVGTAYKNTLSAEEQHITLRRAMASKAISLIAIGKGGAMGNCLKLNMKNNTDKELTVVVDPGLIFTPTDTSYQNLVALGTESVTIKPGIAKEIAVNTFCGKSYAMCPYANLRFTFWKQGDSNMVKMLNFARENNIVGTDISLVQRAVWTFTNRHCLRTVYSQAHPQLSEKLVKYLASIRKVNVPEYFAYYDINQHADRPIYTGEHQKASVMLKWGNDGYRLMFVKVYNAKGEVYKKIESGQYIDKDGHTLIVEFNADHDPPGAYTIALMDETNKIWDKKIVVVGDKPECN